MFWIPASAGMTYDSVMLTAPAFHHLHLNSVDPDAAIGWYGSQFPSAARTTWAGEPALAATNGVLLLFSRVGTRPPLEGSAIWHFGWHVTDARQSLETYRSRPQVRLLPLYTSDEGGQVMISSDTWPGVGGVLGLTKAQIAQARSAGIEPKRGAGFAYMEGPDGALVEYAGNHPAERFNHVHLWQDDPFCAQLWYEKHLNAPLMEGRERPADMTEATCRVPRGADPTWPSLKREGMYRTPRAAVTFSDVALAWYPPQGDASFADSRGHLVDHIGLGVTDLDAWVEKLRREDVKLLEEPYALGDTRAVMIEGPSREAIELVEVV
jgi:catechol 2,3-dioxygenase-like lactoylglutathione lyase family enzyme